MSSTYDIHINIVRVEYNIKPMKLLGHNLIGLINLSPTQTDN